VAVGRDLDAVDELVEELLDGSGVGLVARIVEPGGGRCR